MLYVLTPVAIDSTAVIGISILQFGFWSRFRRWGGYKFDSYGFRFGCSVFFSKICTFGQSGEQFTWTLHIFLELFFIFFIWYLSANWFGLLLIFQVHDEEYDRSVIRWRCFVVQNASILVRIQVRIHCVRHRFVQRKAKLFKRYKIMKLVLLLYIPTVKFVLTTPLSRAFSTWKLWNLTSSSPCS